MPPNHVILCRPLLLLPSIFPSIRVFSNESAWEQLWGDTPHPRAEKAQQDGRCWSGGSMAAVRLESGSEGRPHVQEQRRRPSKMVGAAKSFGIKPHTHQKRSEGSNLLRTRTQRAHRDWDRTVFGLKIKVINMPKQKPSVLKLSNLSKVIDSNCILNASAPTFIHQPQYCPQSIFPSKGRRDVIHNISTKEN